MILYLLFFRISLLLSINSYMFNAINTLFVSFHCLFSSNLFFISTCILFVLFYYFIYLFTLLYLVSSHFIFLFCFISSYSILFFLLQRSVDTFQEIQQNKEFQNQILNNPKTNKQHTPLFYKN